MLDIIVVPSFNRYLYTTRLERGNRKPISPIIKRIVENREIENGMIVTLDGSIVGGIESLNNII
jgi:metallophosphoesterase superfamily enzyme